MDTLRIGMVGAGAISRAHLPAVAARDDCELACIADIDMAKASERAEQFGAARAVADYHELIAMDDVDAVIIGVPARFHAEIAVKAADAGKHVLCEKPMARTLAECDAMAHAAQANRVTLAVGFVRRFDPVWGKVRELVLEGRVGRPCLWRRAAQGSSPQPPNYGPWYAQSEFSDGPLSESAAHDFDFVRYTFGDAKAVTASVWHMSRTGDVLDTGTVIVDFHSGDQMQCFWSWGLPPKCSGATVSGLDVLGPDGAIREPQHVQGNEYTVTVAGANGHDDVIPFTMDRTTTWFHEQLDNFIQSIRGAQSPRGTAADGRKAQEICLAAFESTQTGRRVGIAAAT